MSYKRGRGSSLERSIRRSARLNDHKNREQDVAIAHLRDSIGLSGGEVELSSGQVQVLLPEGVADSGVVFYIYSDNADGGALPESQYDILNPSAIQLKQSYPAGTILFW